jgi:glutathione synthase/RimK-type ligase-like ATP-grasp enzyme
MRELDQWTGHRENSFEMLGLDIMLDEDLQPWLLEVNVNPGLHLLTDVVNEHHPKFVADMFKGRVHLTYG